MIVVLAVYYYQKMGAAPTGGCYNNRRTHFQCSLAARDDAKNKHAYFNFLPTAAVVVAATAAAGLLHDNHAYFNFPPTNCCCRRCFCCYRCCCWLARKCKSLENTTSSSRK